ncbi:hypothetical protein DFP73DRAFT_593955 [Morchella snyderi]|nr:hypothetical protein DFP73DRAFT_593955 [Morchella snyderi]
MADDGKMRTKDYKIELNLHDIKKSNAVRAHISAWARTNRCFNSRNPKYQQLLDYAMAHPELAGFRPKYQSAKTRNSPHARFHRALNALVQDCMKKVKEGKNKAGEHLDERNTDDEAERVDVKIARRHPKFAEVAVQFVIINPDTPNVAQADTTVHRPWEGSPNTYMIGMLKYPTLVHLYNAACWDLRPGRDIRTLYGASGDNSVALRRPDDSDIIELFDDMTVRAWIKMSTAAKLTCCVVLRRTAPLGRPDTPLPTGHSFLNAIDYRDPLWYEDPAEESDRDIRPADARKHPMPTTRQGLEQRLDLIRKRINRQVLLKKKVKLHLCAKVGVENILESDEEGWYPGVKTPKQISLKTRNMAAAAALWAANPAVVAATAAGTAVPSVLWRRDGY